MRGKYAAMCLALLALAACKSTTDTHGAVRTGDVIGKSHIEANEAVAECWRLTLKDKYGRIGYVCLKWPQDWENVVVSDPLPDGLDME